MTPVQSADDLASSSTVSAKAAATVKLEQAKRDLLQNVPQRPGGGSAAGAAALTTADRRASGQADGGDASHPRAGGGDAAPVRSADARCSA